MTITAIGFDADDTLWHNESMFHMTQQEFLDLLKDHGDPAEMTARLNAVERRNHKLYGYGAKGFTLSMIETALDLTHGEVPGATLERLLALGRALLEYPIEPLEGVTETLAALKGRHRLLLITKGDLLNQEQKLARSGLADYFDAIEIVSEKDAVTYRRIFARHALPTESAVMIGNSLKSDVLPALEAGLWGIHIPYPLTAAHEVAEPPQDASRYAKLETIAEVPLWLQRHA